MDPLVSVIIPVYNVRPYLARAVDSLLCQTLAAFELILVDDGSTDGSDTICDGYAAADGRVRVIHQPNSGAPAARNKGITLAVGKYMYFMDGDDWSEPNMLEKLAEAAEENAAQLVVAGFCIDTVTPGGKTLRQVKEAGRAVFADKAAFRAAAAGLFDENLLYTPWNKLISGEYIRAGGFRFPDTFWDDFPFVLSLIRDVERVTLIPPAGYHFMRERAASETARFQPGMYEKREEEHGWLLGLYDHWGVDDFVSREMIARRYAERAAGCIENLFSPACPVTGRARREKIGEMLKNPRLRESLRLARPRSFTMRCVLLPLKRRWVFAAALMGRIVAFTKRNNHGLFARLKARR